MSFDRNKLRQFNDLNKAMDKSGRIQECFHYDQLNCNGGIIFAHSITENGRLSLIESEVNKQNCIYSFETAIPTEEGRYGEPKITGKVSASTFQGFCKYHDGLIFKPIEQGDYLDTDEQNFLHSYRSFAYTYHEQKELQQTYNSPNMPWVPPQLELLEQYKFTQEVHMYDLQLRKSELNNYLRTKQFKGLDYLTFEKDGLFPFACSFIYNIPVLFDGTIVNRMLTIGSIVNHIIMTFLPGRNRTSVILAAFKNDQPALTLLGQLDGLSDEGLERAITSMIISNAAESYFSPAFWKALTAKEKRAFYEEHERHIILGAFSRTVKFFFSQFNYFKDRFEGKTLGLY